MTNELNCKILCSVTGVLIHTCTCNRSSAQQILSNITNYEFIVVFLLVYHAVLILHHSCHFLNVSGVPVNLGASIHTCMPQWPKSGLRL